MQTLTDCKPICQIKSADCRGSDLTNHAQAQPPVLARRGLRQLIARLESMLLQAEKGVNTRAQSL